MVLLPTKATKPEAPPALAPLNSICKVGGQTVQFDPGCVEPSMTTGSLIKGNAVVG